LLAEEEGFELRLKFEPWNFGYLSKESVDRKLAVRITYSLCCVTGDGIQKVRSKPIFAT